MNGGSAPERVLNGLTEDTLKELRKEIIGKYDPQIRRLYAQIKSENWEEKIKYLNTLAEKFYRFPKELKREEYHTLRRAAWFARSAKEKA